MTLLTLPFSHVTNDTENDINGHVLLDLDLEILSEMSVVS